MEEVVFRYRARQLDVQDIRLIRSLISKHYNRGRSFISRALCDAWQWVQPNGQHKEYAARDLLLRLEERGLIELPPRLRPKNNLKKKSFDQVPLFLKYTPWVEQSVNTAAALWKSSTVKTVTYGTIWFTITIIWGSPSWWASISGTWFASMVRWWPVFPGQVLPGRSRPVTSSSVGMKRSKRRNLHLIANNTRFLIPDWVRVKHLASRVLALSLRQLSSDWQRIYGHPIYLAETFVDISRFSGTCYRAANWVFVGQTKGSAKKGNRYRYHGQPKALYLYPLHRHFRRHLLDDQG